MSTDHPAAPARPLFDFSPRSGRGGPVFVGPSWRAEAVRLAGHTLVAGVVLLMLLLGTGLAARSVSGPADPADHGVAADAR